MSAQCAICMGPITRGMKFVLSGTEVFHPECAAQRGTHNSIGNQRRQQLVELEERVRVMGAKTNQAADVVETTRKRLVALDDQNERLMQDFARAQANERSWRRRYDEAIVERDRALRELAVARQYAQQQPAALVTPESKPRDTRDDTEIRFSLLEIDSD